MEANLYNAVVPADNTESPHGYGDASDPANNSMPTPNTEVAVANPIPVDVEVLKQFMDHFTDIGGNKYDFQVQELAFKNQLIGHINGNGFDGPNVGRWVDVQVAHAKTIMKAMCQIDGNWGLGSFVADAQDPALAVDSLPISDADFLAEFIAALKDGSSVFDMPDTAPLRHWHADMKDEDLTKIARQFLDGFKVMHGAHDENHMYQGYTFKTRYDTVIEVLRKCKGSVYRMSRPSTLDDILANPRKMRQRFIDNQINNAKKKKDGKELGRLRGLVDKISRRERGSIDLSESESGEDSDEEEAQPVSKKRKRGNADPKGKRKAARQSGGSGRHRSASTAGRSISAEAPGMARVYTEDSGFGDAWMERTPSGNGEGASNAMVQYQQQGPMLYGEGASAAQNNLYQFGSVPAGFGGYTNEGAGHNEINQAGNGNDELVDRHHHEGFVDDGSLDPFWNVLDIED